MNMDQYDFKIILLLFINSRLSYREIADHTGLSVNAVYKRVQNLFDLKIIEKYEARIKPYALNALYCFIFGQSNAKDTDKITKELGNHENTWQIIFSSRNYLHVGAMLKNVHQLAEYSTFVSHKGMIDTPTLGILNNVYSSAPIPYITPSTTNSRFDKTDLAIIRALHDDARKPVSDIAEEIKSTPNTIRRRLQRLIEDGIIDLTINFNPVASGDIFAAFRIKGKASGNINELAQKIKKNYCPNIFFSWTFSNLPDFLLSWVWVNNMKELNDLIEKLKKENIESIVFDVMNKVEYFKTWKEKMLFEG